MAHPEWHISCELLDEFLENCPEIEWLNVLMEIEKTNPDPTQMLEAALICFLIAIQKEMNHRHFFGNTHY